MIELMLEFGGDVVIVRINGNKVEFGHSAFGAKLATIDNIKLDYHGVVREFPDLKDNPQWRLEAIGRFKDKIKDYNNEESIYRYILNELTKFGYIPKLRKKNGMRVERL